MYHTYLFAGSIGMQIYSLFLTTRDFTVTLGVYGGEIGRFNARFQSTVMSLNLHFLVEKAL